MERTTTSQESGVRSQESGVGSQESGDRSRETGDRRQETEIAKVIERIVASPGGDELLELIFAVLSEREREILWSYHCQTDAQELGYELGIEKQSAHNDLAIIKGKLGIDTRPELSRRVFSALMGKLKKS
jgi:DNA-binding CsgD family transcriptional regulator